MNLEELKKLQSYSKRVSIFLLEKDQKVKASIEKLLEHNFNEVFYSKDDTKTIERFLHSDADLLIISLPLKNQNIVEFISDIQSKKNDANIVVLTPQDDNYELLKMIDFGLKGIILKPFNLEDIVKQLINILEKLQLENKCQQVKNNLKTIAENKKPVSVYNSYKGIFLPSEALIQNIQENSITLKVQPLQLNAIKYQKHTIVYISHTNEYMKLSVQSINRTASEITFTNGKVIDFHIADYKRFHLNHASELKSSFFYQNKQVQMNTLEINFESALVYVDESEITLTNGCYLDATFGFEVSKSLAGISETVFVKAFAKAEVIKVQPFKSGYLIFLSIGVKKSDQSNFNKFLKNKETTLLNEFKRLIKSR